MTRKDSREQAFILLFEYSFNASSAEDLFDVAREAGIFKEDEYCDRLVRVAIDNIGEIDSVIDSLANGWSAQRLSKVSLAALRLAITEIRSFDDIPNAVSINEAVELIKKFATEQDASFANGILGTFVKEIENS